MSTECLRFVKRRQLSREFLTLFQSKELEEDTLLPVLCCEYQSSYKCMGRIIVERIGKNISMA